MTRSLTLPDDLYDDLAREAAARGLSVESLLAALSKLVVVPEKPSARDRERSRHIERLLDKYRSGRITDKDRETLDRLIDEDYEAATARAERLIAAKMAGSANGANAKLQPGRSRSGPKPRKQSQK